MKNGFRVYDRRGSPEAVSKYVGGEESKGTGVSYDFKILVVPNGK